MSVINRFTNTSDEAIYDEYADSYKKYCQLPKEKFKELESHFNRIAKSLSNLDKHFAKKGEK